MQDRPAAMTRIARAWDALSRDQRLATVAALALLLAMFLPWYQQNAVDSSGLVSRNLNAFAVFSFAEAVILLTALAVLAVLFARAEQRALPVPLPGTDGALVMAAGIWSSLLIILQLFDKPGVSTNGVANVGVQWGIFLALGAAGALAYAGSRMRAAGTPAVPATHAGGYRREGRSGRPARRRRDAARSAMDSPSWLEVPPWVPADTSTRPREASPAGAHSTEAEQGAAAPAHQDVRSARSRAGGERDADGTGGPRTHAGRRAQRSTSAAPGHRQLSFDEREDSRPPPSDPD